MASQSSGNVEVRFKVEATLNTAPGATGATVLRLSPSPGLGQRTALVENDEIRPDQLTSMARHGSREVTGSYDGPMIEGAHDEIFQAIMRSTATASFAITSATASLADISISDTQTIVATNTSTGSGFLGAGIRVGDVFRLSGTATSANNNKNLRVKTVTTHTLTVHGSALTTQTTANVTFTITVLKKLKNGTTPTKRTFYVEEYNTDIDQSEVFGGVKWTGMRIVGTPDGMAKVTFTALGISADTLSTANSPYYTSPTTVAGEALVFADCKLSWNGTDIGTATAFELNVEIAARTQAVIGSTTSPGVFDNSMRVTGSVSIIRQDLSNVDLLHDETEVALHIMLTANMSEPKDCIAFFVPRVKLTAADAPIGGDGASVDTLPFVAGLKETATGYDQTMLTISTST